MSLIIRHFRVQLVLLPLAKIELMYPVVKIKKDRIASVKRRHPWIFSRGVVDDGGATDGDIVEVQSTFGQFLAIAYYQDASIMLRILSYDKIEINQEFWNSKLKAAALLRETFDFDASHTNAYRLFHGEGDQISGLIIDIYGKAAVVQCHTIGVHKQMDNITRALINALPDLEVIYDKSKNALPDIYANGMKNGFLKGNEGEIVIKENGHSFIIDLIESQKTGFFLDQRDNRMLLSKYAKDKNVLNLYCYTGGFSIYALDNGATKVCSIDASKKAIEILDRNVELTGQEKKHVSMTEDVNQYLKEIDADFYDVIIVDPPAFAKSIRKKHNAVQAYKRVNRAAIEKIKSGGLIFTFSCSQVIDAQLFQDTMTAAAIEAGRNCQVLHQMSQGADHPVNIFHPEGKYLKGLVLKVGG